MSTARKLTVSAIACLDSIRFFKIIAKIIIFVFCFTEAEKLKNVGTITYKESLLTFIAANCHRESSTNNKSTTGKTNKTNTLLAEQFKLILC